MIKIAPFEMTCQLTKNIIHIGEKYMAAKTAQGIRPVKLKKVNG
jgi:hypothetical protein